MIKIEHVVEPSDEQMLFVIEGMRNPMNSWDKSDSRYLYEYDEYEFGDKDIKLMRSLAKAGTEHRKFMRMMPIYARITAPLYWWKEFDTYKIGTVANSCSTMHKIHAKEFELEDFSTDHLKYPSLNALKEIIETLNVYRTTYISTVSEHDKKGYWWQLIQILPSSYNQTRNVMMNYEVLANIYHQRKNHKLDEWREFCDWIEKAWWAKELILLEDPYEDSDM